MYFPGRFGRFRRGLIPRGLIEGLECSGKFFQLNPGLGIGAIFLGAKLLFVSWRVQTEFWSKNRSKRRLTLPTFETFQVGRGGEERRAGSCLLEATTFAGFFRRLGH